MKFDLISPGRFYGSNRWNASFFITETAAYRAYDGFRMVTLGELCNERREFLLPCDYPERKFNYVGLENISQTTRMLVGFAPKAGGEVKSRSKVFFEGDILYGRLRPSLNKCLLVDGTLSEGICSTEIVVLVANEDLVVPEYLCELLVTSEVSRRVQCLVAGAALPRVQPKDLLGIEVPIPDRDAQDEVVSEVISARDELVQHMRRARELPAEIGSAFSDYAFRGAKFAISPAPADGQPNWDNHLPDAVKDGQRQLPLRGDYGATMRRCVASLGSRD